MNFQWWCAAQGEAWSWSWQAYPGVWAVVALVAFAGWRLARLDGGAGRSEVGGRGERLGRRDAGGGGLGAAGRAGRKRTGRRAAWIAGTVILWIALDWPVGPLGASYLASVHMLQYLMIGLLVPALLLLGVPPAAWAALEGRPRTVAVLADLANPLAAAVVFNVGMTLTHWPAVVDALRVSQLGSFTLDALWLACGLVFWWPLLAPVPEQRHFHPLFRMGYLFVNGVVLTPPALMLLFSETPLYGVYELAPPIRTTSVLWDQQMAGVYMKVGSAWIMGLGMILVARSWYVKERSLESGAAPARIR